MWRGRVSACYLLKGLVELGCTCVRSWEEAMSWRVCLSASGLIWLHVSVGGVSTHAMHMPAATA